jgi:Antitoxin Phd_YefM, type II toxin-antitoxin system
MSFNTDDIVPINQVRASFSALAEEVRAGREKIITRNGESYVAQVDARRLDHYHKLEREHIHLTLLDEAIKGLADVEAGRTYAVAEARAKYRIDAKRKR